MWCGVVEDFGDETLLWQRSRANHEGWLLMFVVHGLLGQSENSIQKANDTSRITNVQSGGNSENDKQRSTCTPGFGGRRFKVNNWGKGKMQKVAPFVDQASRSLVALGNDPLFGCGVSTAVMPGGEGTYLGSSG